MKSPFLSKTLWINLITAVVAFLPPAQAWVQAHPAVVVDVFAALNFGLRLVTKDQIGFSD